jgi:adenylate cyclase
MSAAVQLQIYDHERLACSLDLVEPVELGRQSAGEAGPYFQSPQADCRRVVIARCEERGISRRQLRLGPLDADRVLLTNVSAARPLTLCDGSQVAPNASRELLLPVVLQLGSRVLRIEAAEPEPNASLMHRLGQATMAPGVSVAGPGLFPALRSGGSPEGAKTLLRWLQSAMGVFQSAAGSCDFFSKAAQAVIDIVGLDSGRVLLLQGDDWHAQAVRTAQPGNDAQASFPSRRVLNTVRQERRTFWELSPAVQDGSIRDIGAVVAAPILDRRGVVLGAVYGDRRKAPSAPSSAISDLEAMLVELIACGVAAGLARLEQEQAALAARVQFEQFFTPELSRQLAAHPDLLEGRDCEVSLLFCDIRGFSRFSERLGPSQTVQWVRDVMQTFSQCVLDHSGVLVDYIGDELMAMWGAPEQQPDHARLACRAALDMLGQLPALNVRWQPVLEAPMEVGIGINSGVARVGNTGSHYKFKYGPLGMTVNLASRVEGATKHLRTRLLITGGTRDRLDEGFAARRLCRVRVVNIAEPVDLYELAPPEDPRWTNLKSGYDQALEAFERGEFRRAAQIVGNLLHEYPDDGPALILLSRSASALIDDSAAFDPIWELPGK